MVRLDPLAQSFDTPCQVVPFVGRHERGRRRKGRRLNVVELRPTLALALDGARAREAGTVHQQGKIIHFGDFGSVSAVFQRLVHLL